MNENHQIHYDHAGITDHFGYGWDSGGEGTLILKPVIEDWYEQLYPKNKIFSMGSTFQYYELRLPDSDFEPEVGLHYRMVFFKDDWTLSFGDVIQHANYGELVSRAVGENQTHCTIIRNPDREPA